MKQGLSSRTLRTVISQRASPAPSNFVKQPQPQGQANLHGTIELSYDKSFLSLFSIDQGDADKTKKSLIEEKSAENPEKHPLTSSKGPIPVIPCEAPQEENPTENLKDKVTKAVIKKEPILNNLPFLLASHNPRPKVINMNRFEAPLGPIPEGNTKSLSIQQIVNKNMLETDKFEHFLKNQIRKIPTKSSERAKLPAISCITQREKESISRLITENNALSTQSSCRNRESNIESNCSSQRLLTRSQSVQTFSRNNIYQMNALCKKLSLSKLKIDVQTLKRQSSAGNITRNYIPALQAKRSCY